MQGEDELAARLAEWDELERAYERGQLSEHEIEALARREGPTTASLRARGR
jgi:hypothetical protein